MPMSPVRAVFFDLGNTLVVSADRSWVPGAKAALADLRSRNLRLGVISNTGGRTREQLNPLLPADFDWAVFAPSLVILSGEVGYEKPSPEIFRRATDSSGVPAGECLFCTEDLIDTLVAQRVGMAAARVQPPPHADIGELVAALAAAGVLPQARPPEGTCPSGRA
ncbi:Phosphoglycolate phosphatase [Gemmata sp. SH-PL17]|nr:Phosphoglycolate phosphatase [Gemmata sp. SH-PL17]